MSEDARRAINDLQVESALLQVLVVHLLAKVANGAREPDEWLRAFADEVHVSIDRVAPPTELQARRMAEALRNRLDHLLYGVRTRLAT